MNSLSALVSRSLRTTSWPIFWISGLAILFSLLVARFSGLPDEPREFLIFVLAASFFPVSVYFLSQLPEIFKKSLLAVFIFFAVSYIPAIEPIAVVLSVIQVLLLRGFKLTRLELFCSFAFNLLVWSFVTRLLWFQASWFRFWFWPLFILTISFLTANVCLIFPHKAELWTSRVKFPGWLADLFFVGILFFASFKTGFNFHHGSFYAGTAELVRQGGLLMRDVPSQYGFLNILFIAFLPIKSIWQSLFVVNSISIFASVLIVYYLLQQVSKGMLGKLFAFLFSFSFVILLPGASVNLNGPNAFPSTGGLRFLCCYALLLIVWLAEKKRVKSESSRINIILGNSVWLLGVFWSSECAIYSSAIWLSYSFFRFFFTGEMLQFSMPRVKKAFLGLLFPTALLALSCILLQIFYILKFGHGPDWSCYFEYAVAYKDGYYALPVDSKGAVWVVLLMFCSIISLLRINFLKDQRGFLIGVAAFFTFWVSCSYFVSRSHENNILNLMPIFVTSLMVALNGMFIDENKARMESIATKLLIIPILTFGAVITIGHRYDFPRFIRESFVSIADHSIDPLVPKLSIEVEELIKKSNLKVSDPLVLLDQYLLGKSVDRPLDEEPQLWLPAAPEDQLCVLPIARQKMYILRFLQRKQQGGWLLSNKGNKACLGNLVILNELYLSKKRVESTVWQLEYFEPRTNSL